MIVPRFWAEGRLQVRDAQRQVTVRRFGWSDESEAAAQAHADARTREALERILAGESLPRRDHKVPYNGAEGLPIREEILERHGEAVITRNTYGSRCLNTPSFRRGADGAAPGGSPTGRVCLVGAERARALPARRAQG